MKRSKKFLSAAVVSAIAAAQMAMPVMADGGSFDVDVTTTTPVIRVVVPTSMTIAVNQFEMGDAGSQIYSSDFAMENRSQIPVKVSVMSTATLKDTTTLLESKADVATAGAGEAWLAMAAMTAASDYKDGSTAFADLAETSKNVTTFVQGEGTSATAEQKFYLAAAGTMKGKLLNANESAADIAYAQFFEVTAQTVADGTALTALLANSDVYVATAAAADGQELTYVAKGGTHTFAAGEVYYTAAAVPTAKEDIDAAKLYMYGDGTKATTGGEAGFRYIGKLSGAQETWTKDDITKVNVAYDIVGVDTTRYGAIAAEPGFTYGRRQSAAPSIAVTEYTVDPAAKTEITVNLGSGDLGAKGVKSVLWQGEELMNTDNDAVYDAATKKVALDETVGAFFGSQNLLPATITIVFDMDDANAEPVSIDVTLKSNN